MALTPEQTEFLKRYVPAEPVGQLALAWKGSGPTAKGPNGGANPPPVPPPGATGAELFQDTLARAKPKLNDAHFLLKSGALGQDSPKVQTQFETLLRTALDAHKKGDAVAGVEHLVKLVDLADRIIGTRTLASRPAPPPPPPPPSPSATPTPEAKLKDPAQEAFEALQAALHAKITAALAALQARTAGPKVKALATGFDKADKDMLAAVTKRDFAAALVALKGLGVLAEQVIAAQDADRADALREKQAFETLQAALQTKIAAASAALQAQNAGPKVKAFVAGFGKADKDMQATAGKADFAAALTALKGLGDLADQVLAAQAADRADALKAKGIDDAAKLRAKQVADQEARYNEIAPILGKVKGSYLPEGAADNIGGSHTGKEPEFKAFLAALKKLEASKKGIAKASPVPAATAMAIKDDCDALIAAAQAYLALARKSGNSKEIAHKTKICEEHIKAARHYGMAMVLETIPKPGKGAPLDLEAQARLMGLMAAFSYEQGYQEATGLDSAAGKGASDSYWIKSKSVDAKTGEQVTNKRGDFIFKPMAGEDNPVGMNAPKGAGAIKEALASSNAKLFAAQTGIDLGVPETNVVAVGQYAIEGGDPNKGPELGSVQQHAGASAQLKDIPKDVRAKIKREDVHKIALLDIMSLSMDRHGGNIMVGEDASKNPRLVPIDHGGTLPSRADFSAVKKRMGGPVEGVGTVLNTLLSFPAAYEKFDDETLAKLELLDPDAIEKGMKDQRDALGKVHPGLDPGSKVSDDSLHMSKRAMMFLKHAAKSLSPAEIQIAITAHGEALFDAPDDTAFYKVADKVIQEQMPKKAAYEEVMFLDRNEHYDILNWLEDNKWQIASEGGRMSAGEFLNRDPASALKLYKAQIPNKNPVQPADWAPKPPTGSADYDSGIEKEICEAFPSLAAGDWEANPQNKTWKTRAFHWAEMKKIKVAGLSGMDAVEAAIKATGARRPTGVGDALKALLAWQELHKNPQAVAELKPVNGSVPLSDLLEHAVNAPKNRTSADGLVAAALQEAAKIDETKAVQGYIQRLHDETATLLKKFYDKKPAAALDKRAKDALAKRDSDLMGAQADMRSVLADAIRDQDNDFRSHAINLLTLLEKEIQKVSLPATDAYNGGDEEKFAATIASYKANIPSSHENTVAQIIAFAEKTLSEVATMAKKPAPAKIPPFSWSQSAVSAAKKAAVAAKLFKDKNTGMTAALDAALKAQKTVAELKASLSDDKRVAALQKAIDVHEKFAAFVKKKLRVLSGDAGWAGFCDGADTAARDVIAKLQAQIDSLNKKNG